jgi:hypothetical protein
MLFDQFVNKILKEALVSSIAPSTAPKEKEAPKTNPPEPKTLSSVIGQPTQQQKQVTPTGTPAQQPQDNQQDSSNQDVDSSDAIKGLADAIEKGNKQQEDFYKKIIATMTAQKGQASTTTPATTAPQTNIPNAQQIIAGLSKM